MKRNVQNLPAAAHTPAPGGGARRSMMPAGRHRVGILAIVVLAAATTALSDQHFVTEARQTAWVLSAAGGELRGGRLVGTATLGEGLVAAELRGTDKIMHPGFQAKKKLLGPAPGAIGEDSPVPQGRTRLIGNAPNPFNPATMVRFNLAAAGVVTLRIYDVRGRLVRTLVAGSFPAGEHAVTWDGRSDGGAPVASGVYLLDMEAGGSHTQHKMTLAR